MKKVIIIVCFLLVLLVGYLGLLFVKKIFSPKQIHYHAAFVVFENGKKKDFSAFEYMYVKPCLLDEKDSDKNSYTQLKKAHLHDNVGDVVHVEQAGSHWQDIFTNIKYSVKDKKFVGYINGKKIDNFLSKPILPYDVLVVFEGNNGIDTALLSEAPTEAYIQKIEKKSKNCSD